MLDLDLAPVTCLLLVCSLVSLQLSETNTTEITPRLLTIKDPLVMVIPPVLTQLPPVLTKLETHSTHDATINNKINIDLHLLLIIAILISFH